RAGRRARLPHGQRAPHDAALGGVAQESPGGAIFEHGHGVTEWFRSAKDGIEHGFTFATRVAEIAIPIHVTGADDVHTVARGYALGEVTYTDLHVRDARGRELLASMDWAAADGTLW